MVFSWLTVLHFWAKKLLKFCCGYWERPSENCEIVIFEFEFEYSNLYSNSKLEYSNSYSNLNSNISISQILDGRSQWLICEVATHELQKLNIATETEKTFPSSYNCPYNHQVDLGLTQLTWHQRHLLGWTVDYLHSQWSLSGCNFWKRRLVASLRSS